MNDNQVGSKIVFNTKEDQRHPTSKQSGSVWTALIEIALLGVSFFLLYNVGKSIYITNEKMKILTSAEKEVNDLRLQNLSLILEKNNVNSDTYIEMQARDRLNLSKEGDILFVIPDSVLENTKIVGQDAQGNSSVLGANDKKTKISVWTDFFIQGI